MAAQLGTCCALAWAMVLAVLCNSPAHAEVSVVDDLGHQLVLPQPARRVIALAPHIVEMVYAVGAGERLVGAVSFSNYPSQARQLPRVGSYRDFSLESILRLKPELVIAWYSGNGSQRVAPIEALGIPVFFMEPRRLRDIGRLLATIGELLDAPQADSAREDFESRLQELQARYGDQPAISVFYQVWNEPIRTVSDKHLIGDVMRLCGGRNIFADAMALAPEVSIEAILRRDPQVIVASGMAQERPEWLDDWRRWPSLQAVREKQLKFIPPDILQRHTPRILDGAQQMCEHLQAARQHYNGH